MYRKIKYRKHSFYLEICNISTLKGFRNTVQGITFICINEKLSQFERSKELHRLLKGEKLFDIHGRRLKISA